MTATVSTKKEARKINPALHNWKSNVKENKKFTVILAILHLVAVPAFGLAGIISIYSKKGGDGLEMYAVIAACTTALAAFLGIFAAVDSFRCLYDKSVVDMKLALPLNNVQRFFSNFLSGLFTYLAPFFSAQALSVLLCGYGCLFMDGRTFYRITYDYSGDIARPVEVPYVCDVFGEAMPVLLKLIAGGTLCMLMLYVTTVLITICCGSKFEAIAYTILINVLIPATILCVFYSMYNGLYGIESGDIAMKVMLYICVAGGIVATFDWASKGDLLYGAEYIDYGIWFLVFTLIIAALFALSFFLYRKRRAEQVSKPFVFKLAYYIAVTCATFCVVSLFVAEGGELAPTIIISGIIYMIFEVVTNRGFKKFWLSIIKYAATFIAVVAVIQVCEATEGFGAVQRVPSVSAIKSIELDYSGFYNDMYIGYDYFTGETTPAYLIKDKENIETVISAHQAIVDFYNENNDKYDYEYYSFAEDKMATNGLLTITYNLKTGGSFTRTYYGYSAEPTEILTALDTSEEFKRQAAENFKERILNTERYYEEEMERIRTSEDRYDYASYDASVANRIVYTLGSVKNTYSTPSIRMESLVERDFFNQLADAYYKDVMAINEENHFHSKLKNVWIFNVSFSGMQLIVPESFTNTVELLEYFDFGLMRVEELSDEAIYNSLINTASNSRVMLFTEDEYRELYSVDDELPLHADYSGEFYYDYIRNNAESIVYDFDSEFFNLIREAMPRNIVPENGYVIYVSGFSGTIPEDLYSYASSVPRSKRNENREVRYSQLYNELNGYSN